MEFAGPQILWREFTLYKSEISHLTTRNEYNEPINLRLVLKIMVLEAEYSTICFIYSHEFTFLSLCTNVQCFAFSIHMNSHFLVCMCTNVQCFAFSIDMNWHFSVCVLRSAVSYATRLHGILIFTYPLFSYNIFN